MSEENPFAKDWNESQTIEKENEGTPSAITEAQRVYSLLNSISKVVNPDKVSWTKEREEPLEIVLFYEEIEADNIEKAEESQIQGFQRLIEWRNDAEKNLTEAKKAIRVSRKVMNVSCPESINFATAGIHMEDYDLRLAFKYE